MSDPSLNGLNRPNSARVCSNRSTVILRWESLLSPRFFRYGGMISWVVGNSKSKNSPVFKAFIIESVTGINDQISWKAFLVLVVDFQHEIGDEGLFLSLPAVIFGFALSGCLISTRMRIIITDVLIFLPWHTTIGFCCRSKVLPGAKEVEQRGLEVQVTWKRLGTNIRAGGVFVDFASKPADYFSFSSLFNRATIINTSWAWVCIVV